MTKVIQIVLMLAWLFSAPIMILAIGFASLEIFNPVGLFDDILDFKFVDVFIRLAAFFTILFPLYFLFFMLRKDGQDNAQNQGE